MTYSSLTKTTNNVILKMNRISTNRQFSKEDIQMANRNMRRHSSGTCKLKPQWAITSSLLEHLLSETQEVTSVGEDVEKRKPFVHYWWECRLMQPLWKTVWRFLKKIRDRTIIWSIKSISEYLSEGNKNSNSKRHSHTQAHCSIVYNSQDMEAT